jgi:hypothetical protein
MNKIMVKLDGGMFLMEKAKTHKYIKRIPNAKKGKGYIYFYTREQWKEYQKTGKIPQQKEGGHDEGGGVFNAIMKFFGLKDESKVQEKITAEYDKHKDKLKGVSQASFADHMEEYFANKEKWDARINKDPGQKSEKKATPAKAQGEKKTALGTGGKKFNLSVMKVIAGIYGGKPEAKPEEKKETGGDGKSDIGNIQHPENLTDDQVHATVKEAMKLGMKKLEKNADIVAKEVEMAEKQKKSQNVIDKLSFMGSVYRVAQLALSDKKMTREDIVSLVDTGSDVERNPKPTKSPDNFGTMEDKDKQSPTGALRETLKDKEKKSETQVDIFSDAQLKNKDGKYKTKISYEPLDKKNFKNENEKKAFDILKPKNGITDIYVIKPVFHLNKTAIDDGVWTDSKIMIMDKETTDKIYNVNKQNDVLYQIKEMKKHGATDEEIKESMEPENIKKFIEGKENSGTFPNWKQVLPKEENIDTKELVFTGKYNENGARPMIFSNGEDEVAINVDYLATVRSLFPNAKLYMSGHSSSPVVVKEDGKMKAVIMPVHMRDEISYSHVDSEENKENKSEEKLNNSEKTHEQELIEAGGKEWKTQDGNKHRIYFNKKYLSDLLGFEANYYNTGNISAASLNSGSISNSRARKLLNQLDGGLFYDVKEKKWSSKSLGKDMENELIKLINEKLEKNKKSENKEPKPLQKARSLGNGRYIMLEKGKKAETGEIRERKDGTKWRREGAGKWVKVKEGKPEKKEGKPDEPKKKEKPHGEKKSERSEENKKRLRETVKKIANIVAAAFSGRDTTPEAAEATKQLGENVESKKKIDLKNKEDQKTQEKGNNK